MIVHLTYNIILKFTVNIIDLSVYLFLLKFPLVNYSGGSYG